MSSRYQWPEQKKGISLTVVSFLVVSSVMFIFRDQISVATTALVLVMPVIFGTVIGGFSVGLTGIVLGFLIYDFIFIPPYYTLTVGRTQNWIALGVYAVVVILVSRVVSNLKDTRTLALQREKYTRQLFELSQLLIGDKELNELLKTVTETVQTTFQFDAVVLLLPGTEKLEIGASAGRLLNSKEMRLLIPDQGVPATLHRTSDDGRQTLFSLALTAGGKPLGLLAMSGPKTLSPDIQLLSTFANHAALAIEQAQLKRQVNHTKLLEETDRWRKALLGSVSHDLRTPLASIKAAASGLSDAKETLDALQKQELLDTISTQTDHLTRLVVNLLDMTRIEAGVLSPNKIAVEITELIEEGIAAIRDSSAQIQIAQPDCARELFVSADHVLISQVIANLLENALRYSPKNEPITISIEPSDTELIVSVTDHGPGVPPELREQIFEMFKKDPNGGRAGLGLAIAKAFVTAHGEQLEVSDSPSGGACFRFSLPLVPIDGNGYLDDQTTPN
ncbi:MAG: DUF4118 domain-containing protein [Acidimicrobiaceae bacterium]|nr:DUF4118 domain-containing protein [Acidimicrobiaceae bacterium]